MVGPLFWAGVILVVAVVGVVLLVYGLASLRNQRTGRRGVGQHSHLTCPKCQGSFDYDWIPGVSFTAVRLGKYRYMACPLCHQWSLFDVWDARPPSATDVP
jgi:hypothetical protein